MATERITIIVNEDGSRTVKRNLEDVGESASLAAKGVAALSAVLAVIGTGEALKALKELADTYTLITNRLKLVTTSTENLTRINDELFASAQRTRSSFEATTDLYARIARNADALGLSQRQLLDITETVNKAIRVSGTSAEEAKAGLVQLGQALGSGVLRGDELNSILENMPRLAKAIADGMGVTVGQLRKLGAEGALTSQKVVDAIQKSAPVIAEEFAKLTPTVGEAFTVMGNAVLQFVGKLDQTYGVSKKIAEGILYLANNFDTIVKIALVAGAALLAVFGPALIAGIFAVTAAMISFGVATTVATGGLNLIIPLIAAVVAAAYLFGEQVKVTEDGVTSLRDVTVAVFQIIYEWIQTAATYLMTAWNTALTYVTGLWNSNSQAASDAMQLILDYARTVVNFYIGYWVGAINSIIKAWDILPAAIQDVGIMAWNGLISGLQTAILAIYAGVDLVIRAWDAFPDAVNVMAAKAMGFLVSIVEEGVRTVLKAIQGLFTYLGSAASLVGAKNPFEGLIDPDKALAGISAVKKGFDDTVSAFKKTGEALSTPDYLVNGLEKYKGQVSGAAKQVGDIVQDEFGKSMGTDWTGVIAGKATDGINAVLTRAQQIARDRIAAQKDADNGAQAGLNAASGPGAALDAAGGKGKGKKAPKEKLSDEMKAQKEVLKDITGPLDTYTMKMNALNDLLAAGKITVDQYNQEWQKLRITFLDSQNTWGAGVERAFLKMSKTANDTGKNIEDVLTNAFKGAEDALVDFVTTGKLDVGKLVDSIIADIARLAIRQAITGPLSSWLGNIFSGLGGGGAGGFNIGASTGAVSNSFNPFAALSKFATGGSFTVGGQDGHVDTQPVSFMASPGERVSVTRPGEVESQGSAGPMKTTVNITNNGQPVQAQATTTQQPDGSLQIDVLLDQIEARMSNKIAKGGSNINGAMEGRYGLNAANGIQT